MSIKCPHCDGEVGYVESLEGKRVGCPHCSKGFTMPPDDCVVPPQHKQAAEPAKQPTAEALLDNLLQAQVASNQLITQLLKHTVEVHGYLNSIRTWIILVFILMLLLSCFGVTVTINGTP